MNDKPSKESSHRVDRARRQFLRTMVLGTSVVGAALLGLIPVIKRWVKRLRPPGALLEQKFLAACIKCGQCVQVCPVQAIKLADIDSGVGVGTPYIEPRIQACDFSCDALQCILACPTGALNPKANKKEEVHLGKAELIRPQTCLAVQGKGFKGKARGEHFKGLHRYNAVDRWNPILIADHPYDLEICDLCVRECPIEGAIELVEQVNDLGIKSFKPVIHDSCVGCGMCEMICPVEESCIQIHPNSDKGVMA